MTVRDSITRTGARTPGAEDSPTSMAAHGRAPIPTQCGITAVVSTCAKGRHKPNISRCMPGAGLTACFHDVRRQDLIEHEVVTLVGRRGVGGGGGWWGCGRWGADMVLGRV